MGSFIAVSFNAVSLYWVYMYTCEMWVEPHQLYMYTQCSAFRAKFASSSSRSTKTQYVLLWLLPIWSVHIHSPVYFACGNRCSCYTFSSTSYLLFRDSECIYTPASSFYFSHCVTVCCALSSYIHAWCRWVKHCCYMTVQTSLIMNELFPCCQVVRVEVKWWPSLPFHSKQFLHRVYIYTCVMWGEASVFMLIYSSSDLIGNWMWAHPVYIYTQCSGSRAKAAVSPPRSIKTQYVLLWLLPAWSVHKHTIHKLRLG